MADVHIKNAMIFDGTGRAPWPGEVIVRQCDRGGELYLLLDGSAEAWLDYGWTFLFNAESHPGDCQPAFNRALELKPHYPEAHLNRVQLTLDERGENIDTGRFAAQISKWRDQAVASTVFVIGGADGLSPELGANGKFKGKLKLAFGAATWPHQMVRVMLLEQLYRAATILAAHPYHRA